ncbi:MAG: hypothetical protein MJ232_06555 [archaeon]|nr:hypothetical protein [archaeon]
MLRGCHVDWNLNAELILWTNKWFKLYKERAKVDLTYHHFDYNGCSYTQLEMIDKMIDLTEIMKKEDDFSDEYADHVKEFFKIWELVFPAMWW